MMTDDYKVKPRSSKEIERLALAWRDALGVADAWAPDVIRLLETEVPKLVPEFALVVKSDNEMGDAEAYTEFNPPYIAVRGSVYALAGRKDGRSRMTFAHELGHLVMHPGVVKLRSEAAIKSETRAFESAEWQAKRFAALFLVPDQIARMFDAPAELAECCQVSAQAARIRFDETSNIRSKKPLDAGVTDVISILRKL
jgi:Zn-dependent peptidase ImmA (M78 family)